VFMNQEAIIDATKDDGVLSGRNAKKLAAAI
jgi:hypothetical protein